VALIEADQVVSLRIHHELNRHGERMLPLVEELLADAGWSLSSLDRIGVGVGPGSFTGLRIGVALAQGVALGLDRPVVGVSSLLAMAFAAPPADLPTLAVLDARRDEYFVALFSSAGTELFGPRTISQTGAEQALLELVGGPFRSVGLPAVTWANGFQSELTDLPSAAASGRLAARLDPAEHPALPAYVRPADAIKPNLPPSPLQPV
jgi:tRNA threonylcarbamoyladenosine biosynthesis protein TsaB